MVPPIVNCLSLQNRFSLTVGTEYSLNDRLLLSGVVHLTMRETLKELHIRIPSPPPPLKVPKPPPKQKPPKRYKSPYLVPFTFTPQPRKHTGIYKNNHIQYPDSPYFSYINELVRFFAVLSIVLLQHCF